MDQNTETGRRDKGITSRPENENMGKRKDGKTENGQTTGLGSTGKLITGKNGAGFFSSLTAGNPYRN